MNNSKIAVDSFESIESPVDNSGKFREKEAELLSIIEAIQAVAESQQWQVLKLKIFDGVVESLKRQRDIEIEKKPLNGPMIHSLNGQLAWAKKYSNFETLASIYKLELQSLRTKIDAT